MRPFALWTLSLAIALVAPLYHYERGPQAPVRGTKDVGGAIVQFALAKKHSGSGDAEVRVAPVPVSMEGTLLWRPSGAQDGFTYVRMERTGNGLTGRIPHQPAGRSAEYRVVLQNWGERVWLTGPAVPMLFQNDVPAALWASHLLLLFLGLIFASRAGLEAWLAKEPKLHVLARNAFVLLMLGGVGAGSVLQFVTVGSAWTGWPLGSGTTSALTLAAALLWAPAVLLVRRNRRFSRVMVLAAAMATISAFFAAHGAALS